MDINDKVKFGQCMAVLAEGFQVDIRPQTIEVYWQCWDLSADDFDLACHRAVMEVKCTYGKIPTLAQLRELAQGMSPDARASQAWAAVMRAMAANGTARGVDFDDPLTNASVRQLGGWVWLGRQPQDWTDQWGEKRFTQIYRDLMRYTPDADRMRALPGQCQGIIAAHTGLPSLPGIERPAALPDFVRKLALVKAG